MSKSKNNKNVSPFRQEAVTYKTGLSFDDSLFAHGKQVVQFAPWDSDGFRELAWLLPAPEDTSNPEWMNAAHIVLNEAIDSARARHESGNVPFKTALEEVNAVLNEQMANREAECLAEATALPSSVGRDMTL